MNLRVVPHPAEATKAIILVAFGFSAAANWPGHLSYDSVIQLLEGRTAIYANWHPPVMSWLLGLSDAVGANASLLMLFDCALLFGAFLLLALVQPARSWAAAVVLVLAAATPQLLIYPGIVWKDVLFAAASLAGFACLAAGAAWWPRIRWRFALLAMALLLLVLAALARQNGIVLLVFAAATLGWIAARAEGARTGAIYAVSALAAALLLAAGCRAALDTRVRGDLGPEAQLKLLESYDLIGALTRDPALPLPVLSRADPTLVRLMRRDGPRLYSPVRVDTLNSSAALMDAIGAAPPSAVAADWRGLILGRPGLYLATRWAAFRWVFLTPDAALCYPYYLGVDGPRAAMMALGLTHRWDSRDQALDSYGAHFERTPILSHGFYALLALAGLVVLLYRRRPADLAMAGLLAGALAFAASFFVISISCDYRYLYLLDLAALAGTFYLALDPHRTPVYSGPGVSP